MTLEEIEYNKWLHAYGSANDRWINLSYYDTLSTIKPGFNNDYETSGMGDYTETVGMTEEELLEMPRLPGWTDTVYRMCVTHGGDHGFWSNPERTLLMSVPLDQLEMIIKSDKYLDFDHYDIEIVDGEMDLVLDLHAIQYSKKYPESFRRNFLVKYYEQNKWNTHVFRALGVDDGVTKAIGEE